MPTDRNREETLFAAALNLPDDERAAFLERECGGDALLHQRVESLLRAHGEAGTFIDRPVGGQKTVQLSTGEILPRSEQSGERIGRFKLLEKIGEGGFGDVWMAEQEEPVRRRVALKIIKLGMDTREVVARFEAERQALALMDHPNIARVFDGGATDSGRPYFVMELVRGVPITRYCDDRRLTTRERLELFAQVCQAVQHAHQKGVIHRDLKPSNILVTELDGGAVPKVIDFGVARATEHRLTEKTLFTRFGQMIGTPAYMSPEQAGLGGLDIDTRSDVYSLGVVLYELLTGRTPFDPKKLLEAGYDAILKTIREVEPPKPSTKLSTLSPEELSATAQQRRAEPQKLNRLIRGELDWIVMKCLEKDRNRRYETANVLAQDLERYLNHEPVLAVAPSLGYRCLKFARRNRVALAAASAFAMMLLAGSGVSALVLLDTGRPAEAEPLFRQALAMRKELLGNEHAEVATSLHGLAWVLSKRGSLGEAEDMFSQALAMQKKLLGKEHPDVAGSLGNLAGVLSEQGKLAEAETLCRDYAYVHMGLQAADGKRGGLEEAIKVLTKALRGNAGDLSDLAARSFLFGRRGQWHEAVADLSRVMEIAPKFPAFALGPLLVETGEADGYRSFQRRMLAVFSFTEDPPTAAETAMGMLLKPSSTHLISTSSRLADLAIIRATNHARLPYFQLTKALAEYRQGQFASASDWAHGSLAGSGTNHTMAVAASAVLAMAQHELKRTEEARKTWAQANELAQTNLPKMESGDLGENWPEWLIARILLREATDVIGGGRSGNREAKP